MREPLQGDLGLFGSRPEADARSSRRARLAELDQDPLRPIYALTPVPFERPHTFSAPVPFVCSDGRVWWLKEKLRAGLSVELVAGRLAQILDAGQPAEIVFAPRRDIAPADSHSRILGMVVGVLDLPHSMPTGQLVDVIGDGRFDVRRLDGRSRARVVALQTILSVTDPQVFVSLNTGRLYSYDHDECLNSLIRGPMQLVLAPIPGVNAGFGSDRRSLDEAIGMVEAITEEQVLNAVACIPDDLRWQAPFARRIAMAEMVIRRQKGIGEVMTQWAHLS
jgi:hypothetical protein